MTSRNQNTPSAPPNPANKNQGMQALAPMNNQKDVAVAVAYSKTELSEWEIIEFTKEEVDVLLNHKFKGTLFDSKEEWMTEYIKNLKVCIKWFQKGLEDIIKEKDNLHTLLDSSERKYVEREAAMKVKEEELKSIFSELKNKISSIDVRLENVESQELDAIDCHKIEKEARIALEKNQNSLNEKLLRAEQNAQIANEKVKTQEDMYKSLQEYNSKLLNELTSAKDAIDCHKIEKEARMALEKNQNSLKEKLLRAEQNAQIANEKVKTQQEMYTSLKEYNNKLLNEITSAKDAIDCHKIEKEARMALEKNQNSLKEKLLTAEQNAQIANEKVKTQQEMYKSLKEYNNRLLNELTSAKALSKASRDEAVKLKETAVIDANKQAEKEKAAILESLITFRRHYNLLQQEFTSTADSRDNALKQKETAEKEVIILRGELHQLKLDRERQVSELQKSSSKILRYEESEGRTAAECRSLGLKSFKLEKTCSAQKEQIFVLQQQLDAANEKLKMAGLSSSEIITEIMTKYEDQKRIISALEDDLAEAEAQLVEGEKQRKKLHNTISNLKGKPKYQLVEASM